MNPANLPFDSEAMLQGLRGWVECESPTWDVEAVERMLDLAARDMAIMGASIDRIAGRLQCGECGFTTSSSSAQFANRPICPYCDGHLERRNDDDLSVLQTRLQEFRSKTEPLASFFEKMSILHRIDGNRDREAVFSDISRLIEDKR